MFLDINMQQTQFSDCQQHLRNAFFNLGVVAPQGARLEFKWDCLKCLAVHKKKGKKSLSNNSSF